MSNGIVVGIDPGITGAIAFMDLDGAKLLMVEDMPIDKTLVGKTLRSRIARGRLLELLYRARGADVFTERPEARPMRGTSKATGQVELRRPGAAGMLAFGENYGTLIMGCTAAGMSLTEVRPGGWKRALSVPASKDDARRRCQELFPDFASYFNRKSDNGRADSVLVALYGVRVLKGAIRVSKP